VLKVLGLGLEVSGRGLGLMTCDLINITGALLRQKPEKGVVQDGACGVGWSTATSAENMALLGRIYKHARNGQKH